MNIYRFLLPVMLGSFLLVTACNTRVIRGSGEVVTETREVSGFDGISLSGSGEVVIIQNGNESLTIETDDNVMEHIEARVENGELKIGVESGFSILSTTRLIFTVEVDDLKNVAISGSGDIESESIETDYLGAKISGSGDVQISDLTAVEVYISISGSGEVDLAGKATNQDVSISGSGKYRAGDMCSESVEVSISGSGNATVCATETLVTKISGSGSVDYYGSPAVDSSGSGSGKVRGLGE